MTITKEQGIWIARNDSGAALFFTELDELCAMLQRLGWAE